MRLIKAFGFNIEIKNKIYQKVVLNRKLNFAVDKVREKFLMPDSEEMTDKEFVQLLENNDLQKESKKIVRDFHLPISWADIIHKYIIDCEFITEIAPDGIKFISEDGNNQPGNKFYLEISPNTSIKDIKDIWFLVQKEFKKYGYEKTRKKKSKKFNRNLEIYDLKKSGKTIQEIDSITNKKYGQDLDYGNIKTIISNQKKIRED